MQKSYIFKKILNAAAVELREFARETVVQVLHEQAEKMKCSVSRARQNRKKRVSRKNENKPNQV